MLLLGTTSGWIGIYHLISSPTNDPLSIYVGTEWLFSLKRGKCP